MELKGREKLFLFIVVKVKVQFDLKPPFGHYYKPFPLSRERESRKIEKNHPHYVKTTRPYHHPFL